MQKDFDKLGVQIAVISTDDVEMHNMWKAHLEELDYKGRGTQQINFAILDDSDAKASKTYGMLHAPASTNKDIRGVFIIDSENMVRSINFYPMQVGRNMNEIVRIVEALQTTDAAQVLTPANWNEGDDVMVPYFPYTKAQLAANPELKDEHGNTEMHRKQMFFWDGGSKKWKPLPGSNDLENNLTRAVIHLPYAILAVFQHTDQFEAWASWYGDALTPSSPYNSASNNHKIGSHVKVCRLDNLQKCVKVKVVSTGPYVDNRIIDLTKTAFRAIGNPGGGIVGVRVVNIK